MFTLLPRHALMLNVTSGNVILKVQRSRGEKVNWLGIISFLCARKASVSLQKWVVECSSLEKNIISAAVASRRHPSLRQSRIYDMCRNCRGLPIKASTIFFGKAEWYAPRLSSLLVFKIWRIWNGETEARSIGKREKIFDRVWMGAYILRDNTWLCPACIIKRYVTK